LVGVLLVVDDDVSERLDLDLRSGLLRQVVVDAVFELVEDLAELGESKRACVGQLIGRNQRRAGLLEVMQRASEDLVAARIVRAVAEPRALERTLFQRGE